MNKTFIRIFTIADYEEEEAWLRNQHRAGWKLVKMTVPCFYTFESCTPEDVIYRLDYRQNGMTEDYLRMLQDFGWEYFAQCFGWFYFRKPASEVSSEEEGELFSDNASKAERVTNIVRTRLLPLVIIFLCCLIPNFVRVLSGEFSGGFAAVIGILISFLFVIYMFLIIYCGLKLKKLRDRE